MHLKPGKLAAMVGHCCEAYWTNIMKFYALMGQMKDNEFVTLPVETENDPNYWMLYRAPQVWDAAKAAHERGDKSFQYPAENSRPTVSITIELPKDIWNGYVNDIFTKTICEAKNLNNLKTRALPVIEELKLVEGVDWGYINDKCLTDLTPENEDGTTTIGMWFKPLKDEDAFKISKKFKLYRDE